MKIYLGTTNSNKLHEINSLLKEYPIEGLEVEFSLLPEGIEEPEENGDTFLDNAITKADYYAAKLQMPCLADDSGLEVTILDNKPGVFSKRWVGKENATIQDYCDHLIEEMKKKGYESSPARYVCAMALTMPDPVEENTLSTIISTGVCKGVIKRKMRGTHGFGYDPLFYIDHSTTMAELSTSQKNAISHRGKAFRDIMEQLKEKMQ